MDLTDAHMRIWVRLEEIPSVAFLVPKATLEEDKLVGFHLSIPMGYIKYADFFCATTEMVKDHTYDTLCMRHTTPTYHLEQMADTKPQKISAAEVAVTLEAENN